MLICVPSFVTNNGRWVVENQVGKKTLAIDDCDSRQSIYVYGCKDSVLQVNGNVYFSSDVHLSLCFGNYNSISFLQARLTISLLTNALNLELFSRLVTCSRPRGSQLICLMVLATINLATTVFFRML